MRQGPQHIFWKLFLTSNGLALFPMLVASSLIGNGLTLFPMLVASSFIGNGLTLLPMLMIMGCHGPCLPVPPEAM